MAIMVIYRSSGVDRTKYDAILDENGSRREAPPGAIAHFAGFTAPDSVCVIDVWESREQYEKFAERLGPILQRLGAPPQAPEIIEVYGAITFPPSEQYRLAPTPA